MSSLNNIIELGRNLGIEVEISDKVSGKVITLSSLEYPELNLLIITQSNTYDILRIRQHRTAELTKKYRDKKVSFKWISGFMHNYSEIKISIFDTYKTQNLILEQEKEHSKNIQKELLEKRSQEQQTRNNLASKNFEKQKEESKKRGVGSSPSSFENRIYDRYR